MKREPRFVLDHLEYILSRRHRREVLAHYRKAAAVGGYHETLILHEADDSCCRREPWVVTKARICDSLLADGVLVLRLVA